MKNVEISVYCLAYNCKNFIGASIEGILNQKISVDYKVIIHDDFSTDGTADIIKNYAELYPDKIFPILQSENQYSKGIDIYKKYIEPNLEGKYIAICEGDDCWINVNKLQLQYNYMEKHPKCSLCTHNTIKYELDTKKTSYFNNWKDIHILTKEEVFVKGYVHTSSFFLRRDCADWSGKNYWFGDYVLLTWAFNRGEVVSLPQIMSKYNASNPNGLMVAHKKLNAEAWINKRREEINYLNEYNKKTLFKFNKVIKERKESIEFECIKKRCDNTILYSNSKTKIIGATKEIISNKYYPKYIFEVSGLKRLMRRSRYEGYLIYPVWRYLIKKYLKTEFYYG